MDKKAMKNEKYILPKKLFNKSFLLLFQGQIISQLGSLIFMVALIYWLKKNTESASIIGLFFMVSVLPSVLMGPFGGTIVDRYSRKNIIILGDLLNGSLILMTGILMIMLPTATNLIIVLLFITVSGNNLVGAFFRPAVKAALPDLVPTKNLSSANGMLDSSLQISNLVGQSLGGILYSFLGLPILMLINGMAYLVSALSECYIAIPRTKRKIFSNNKELISQLKEDTINGFKYVRDKPGLQYIFLLFTVWYFFGNTITVLLPFFVDDELHSTPVWYGILMSSAAFGILIGNGLVSTVNIKLSHRHKWVVISLFIAGVSHGCIGYSNNTTLALIVMMINGITGGVLNVLLVSTIQITTPSEIRGRVFGLLGMVTTSVAPISMALTGIIFDVLNASVVYIFLVSGLCIALFSIYLLLFSEFKNLLTYEKAETESH